MEYLLNKLTRESLVSIVRAAKLKGGKLTDVRGLQEVKIRNAIRDNVITVEFLEKCYEHQEASKTEHKQAKRQQSTEQLSKFKPGDRIVWSVHRRYSDHVVHFGTVKRVGTKYLMVDQAKELHESVEPPTEGSMDYPWNVDPDWDSPPIEQVRLEPWQCQPFQEQHQYANYHYEQ
jgi:hypothetical protein